MDRLTRFLSTAAVLMFVLAACGGESQPAPTATPDISATPSETPTITLTPSETFTPAPTVPSRPTLPPTWTPTATADGSEQAAAPTVSGPFNLNPSELAFTGVLNAPTHSVFLIYAAEGFNPRRVIGEAFYPQWFPDGETFIFNSQGLDNSFDIVIVGDNGRNERNLTANDTISNLNPLLSPDAGRILLHSDRDQNGATELYVLQVNGGISPVGNFAAGANGYDWSPDSQRLVFVSTTPDAQNQELFLANADGTGVMRLSNNATADSQPKWSPDGSQIAFNCGANICLINPDGSNARVLAENGRDPLWSPDGSQIAYICPELCVISPAGGDPQVLTSGLLVEDVAWSLDSTQFAITTTGTEFNLYILNTDGSGLTLMVTDTSPLGGLAWRPSS